MPSLPPHISPLGPWFAGILVVVSGLVAPLAAPSAHACDCSRVDYAERAEDAAWIVIVRAHAVDPVVELPDDADPDDKMAALLGTTGNIHRYSVLHAIKGDPPSTLEWTFDYVGGCLPGIGDDNVGLLLLDGPGSEPNMCQGDGALEWLMDREMPSLLDALGADRKGIDADLFAAALGATTFEAYAHGRGAFEIEYPYLTGESFAVGSVPARFVDRADDDGNRVEVLTALEHDGLALLEVRLPSEGVVVRATLLDGDVLTATLVEQ